MLSCRELQNLIDIYLDGELEEERCTRIDEHLSCCPTCQDLLACRKKEWDTIRNSFPVPELNPFFSAKVSALLLNSRTPSHPVLPWIKSKQHLLAPALAGLMLLSVIATISLYPQQRTRSVVTGSSQNRVGSPSTLPGTGEVGGSPQGDGAKAGGEIAETSSRAGSLQENLGNKQLAARSTPSSQVLPQNPAVNSQKQTTWKQDSNHITAISPSVRNAAVDQSPKSTDFRALNLAVSDVAQLPFMPSYLPNGFCLAGIAASDNSNNGKNSSSSEVTASYLNSRTGSGFTLQISEISSLLAPTAATAPEGEQTIVRLAEKNGSHYQITISGALAPHELNKVADSLR